MLIKTTRWLKIAVPSVLILFSSTTRADPGVYYQYDALGRLTSVCNVTPTKADLTKYSYDSAGNRTQYAHTVPDITLGVDQSIYSANGKFMFRMQSDNNLVVYGNLGSGWIPMGWSTNTVGSGATIAAFQGDGNLVLYGPSGSVWASNTWPNYCATLSVENDGNVLIRNMYGQVVWSTGTGGH